MGKLKAWFIAGVLIWLPIGVTVLVVLFLIDLADQVLVLIPPQYQPETLIGFHIPGLGFLLSLIVIIVTGMIFANIIGKQFVAGWENLLARIPLIRSIYSSVKQITETLFSTQGKSFRKVVLVEYPRRELWTLAFVTGDAAEYFEDMIGEDLVHLYVPTTPNPTSGFFLMVPKKDIMELDISVDVGLKMILSTGVVVPPELSSHQAKDLQDKPGHDN